MLRSVTKIGLQVGVLTAFVCLLTPSANANPNLSVAPNSEMIFIQTPGYTPNASIYTQPAVRPPTIDNRSAIGAIQLWPSPITYSRVTDFMSPFVQSDLRFGIRYTYNFLFSLRARNTDVKGQAIPDGWYYLNIAVILKDTDSIFRPAAGALQVSPYDRYVTSESLLVPVSNGNASTKITLNFPNVTSTTLINHLYIELIPLKENCERKDEKGETQTFKCISLDEKGRPVLNNSKVDPLPGFKSYTVEMPFVPYTPAGAAQPTIDQSNTAPLGFTDESLTTYLAKARLYQRERMMQMAKILTPEQYAEREKLHFLSINDPQITSYSNYWFKDPHRLRLELGKLLRADGLGPIYIPDGDKALSPAICQMLSDRNASLGRISRWFAAGAAQDCVRDRWLYRMSQVTHIGKVNSARKLQRIFSRPMSFAMMANFMINRSHSQDSFSTFSIKSGATLFKALEAFGLPITGGADVGHTVSVADSRSKSESTIGSLSSTLDFNVNALHIPTVGTSRCLLVMPQNDQSSPLVDFTKDAKNGLYICSAPEDTEVDEIYAHVFERGRDTSTVDAFDPLTQSINFSLRGDRDITSFFYLIRQNITANHDSRILPFQMLGKAEEYFSETPLTSPGIIVRPISYEADPAPSFLSKAFGAYSESFMEDRPYEGATRTSKTPAPSAY